MQIEFDHNFLFSLDATFLFSLEILLKRNQPNEQKAACRAASPGIHATVSAAFQSGVRFLLVSLSSFAQS
jgi:hypothetical protein